MVNYIKRFFEINERLKCKFVLTYSLSDDSIYIHAGCMIYLPLIPTVHHRLISLNLDS